MVGMDHRCFAVIGVGKWVLAGDGEDDGRQTRQSAWCCASAKAQAQHGAVMVDMALALMRCLLKGESFEGGLTDFVDRRRVKYD